MMHGQNHFKQSY